MFVVYSFVMSFWGNCLLRLLRAFFVLLTSLLIDILYVISEQINDDDDDLLKQLSLLQVASVNIANTSL